MDLDYEDEDEEYTYEEDGEYDEDGDGDYEAEDDELRTPQSKGVSAGSSQVTRSSMSGDKRSEHGRGIVVPSDTFNIVDCSDIEPIMRSMIEDEASLLDVNSDVAQTLLQQYKWDREKLNDAFFANSEKVTRSAGVDMYVDTQTLLSAGGSSVSGGPAKLARTSSKGASAIPGELFKCRICYDETANAFSMGCGHKFCRPCYSDYLASQVSDGPPCIIAHCPEYKCTQIVTSSVFHALLGDRRSATTPGTAPAGGSPTSPSGRKVGVKSSRLVNQYDTYFIRNFIETCKNMKYCPAPGCEKVAVGSGVTMVRCSCGYPFCMRCGKCTIGIHRCCDGRWAAYWTQRAFLLELIHICLYCGGVDGVDHFLRTGLALY
jgi:ariadne-1